jgi:hypothetical protein
MTDTAPTASVGFDLGQVTGRMLIDFRVATGMSLMSFVDADEGELDISSLTEEALVGVIWLGLRMSGRPDATFDDALDIPFDALDLEAVTEVPTPDPS